MNHSYIEEHNLVERYLRGSLISAEREAFEEHFLDCRECLEEIELAEALQGGLRDVAAVEVAQGMARGGLALVLARMWGLRQALAVALLCVLALPVAWWLGSRSGGVGPLPPQGNIPTFHLGELRSGEGSAPIPLERGGWLRLVLSAEGTAFPDYRAAVRRPDSQEPHWQSEALEPDWQGELHLLFPPGSLPPGTVIVELWGVAAGGGATEPGERALLLEQRLQVRE